MALHIKLGPWTWTYKSKEEKRAEWQAKCAEDRKRLDALYQPPTLGLPDLPTSYVPTRRSFPGLRQTDISNEIQQRLQGQEGQLRGEGDWPWPTKE